MKFVVLVVAMSMLFSCKVTRDHITRYYDVEAFQEQDMSLLLASDSSFTLEDRFGCNQFKFTGKYKQFGTYPGGYLVFEDVQSHKVMVVPDTKRILPVQNGDTAWLINSERIFLHQKNFKVTNRKKLDLREIRYKQIKAFYTEELGEKGFLETFGDGSEKEARRRILHCMGPDLNLKVAE
jgi:hypothetical protein